MTPQEASDLGITPQEGLTVRVRKNKEDDSLSFSYLTGDKWEIQGDNLYISPEGQQYTRPEYEAYIQNQQRTQYYEQMAASGFTVTDELKAQWNNLSNEDFIKAANDYMQRQSIYGYLSKQGITVPENLQQQWQGLSVDDLTTQVEKYYNEQAISELKTQILNNLPPEMAIELENLPIMEMAIKAQQYFNENNQTAPDALNKIFESFQWTPEILDLGKKIFGWTNLSIEGILAWAYTDTAYFLNVMKGISDSQGRSIDQDNLLKALFPEITEQNIKDIFAEPLKNIPAEGMEIPLYQIQGPSLTPGDTTITATLMPDMRVLQDNQLIGYYDKDKDEIVPYVPDDLETAQNNLSQRWNEMTTGEFSWGEVGNWILGAIGVGTAWIDQYIGRPWETALMESVFRAGASFGDTTSQHLIDKLDEAFGKYGWQAIFSQNVGQVWTQTWKEAEQQGLGWGQSIAELGNPVFFIPVGGSFGLAAKFTSKIPVLSKSLRAVAALVNATEKVIAFPITGPLKGLGWIFKQTGGRLISGLTEKWAEKVLNNTEHIIDPMNLPSLEAVIADDLALNWQKRLIQNMAKMPVVGGFVKSGLETAIGWKFFVRAESQEIEDIVARSAVGYNKYIRMGENVKAVESLGMREYIQDPVKYFGLKNGFSQKMADRLLPNFAGEANAGTLEHIINHPEMYNWEGFGKTVRLADGTLVDAGQLYVQRFREIQSVVSKMLENEHLAPEGFVQDWIHRTIEQTKIAPNVKKLTNVAKSFGANQPYEKMRKFKTMIEGIQWFAAHPELGRAYASNPEAYIGSYIQQAFEKVGQEKAIQYLAGEFEKVGRGITATYDDLGNLISKVPGRTPRELLSRYPQLFEKVGGGREIAEKAMLRAVEKQNADHFIETINRAIRGERIPESTLKSIEQRFPELGQRFRALTSENKKFYDELVTRLKESQNSLESLMRQRDRMKSELSVLKEQGKITVSKLKQTTIDTERKLNKARQFELSKMQDDYLATIPDEKKLREAFKVMDFDDRAAFRHTMQGQSDDISIMVQEQSDEIGGIKEFLESDPIEQYRYEHLGKKYQLANLISIREQSFPDYFTVKQAKMLNPFNNFSEYAVEGTAKYDRVPRKLVFQNLEKEYGLSDDEITDRVMKNRELRQRVDDLKLLNKMGQDRLDRIKLMNRLLDETENLAIIPQVEPAASVPFQITKDMESRLKAMGYSQESINAMKPTEAVEILRVPKAETGIPEAGMQEDFFGYQKPYYPPGKGEVTQISMDDFARLQQAREAAGIDTPPDIEFKPQIEGVEGLEGSTEIARVRYEPPKVRSINDVVEYRELRYKNKAGKEIISKRPFTYGDQLKEEVQQIAEARKYAWREAAHERAMRMEEVRQTSLQQGYIMQPSFAGKLQDRDFINAWNKFYGHDHGGLGALKVITDLARILRNTKAALDFSAMVIQGLPSWGLAHAYLFQDPVKGLKLMGAWYRAFTYNIGAFFDPAVVSRYVARNRNTIMERIMSGGSARAIDYVNAGIEATSTLGEKANWMLEHIPFKPFQRAEISFFAAGELVRDEFWRILAPRYTMAQRFELARFLDRITGITDAVSLGVPTTARQLEQSFLWFAPNYTRSCLTVIADIFRGGMTGAETRKAIGGMITAGAVYYTGVQYAISIMNGKTPAQAWDDVMTGFGFNKDPITGEISWKPTANFMTIKIGNYNFGFGGFWYGLLRLSGNIVSSLQKIKDSDHIDIMTILKGGGTGWMDNPFVAWWYGRSSPFFGTVYELASGKDYLGYPFETGMDYAKYILTRFEPIWMEQGLNWLVPGMARQQEIPEGAARLAVMPGELFGLRTFPDSAWVEFYNGVLDATKDLPQDYLSKFYSTDEMPSILKAQKNGKLGWAQLPYALQMDLMSKNSKLYDLYQQANMDSQIRQSADWEQWQGASDNAKKVYYERGDELVKALLSGQIDMATFRSKWSEAGQNYGAILDNLSTIPAFNAIYDYFKSKQSSGGKYNWDIAVALGDYLSIMSQDFKTSTGDFDFNARQKAIDDFIEKWGDDTYQIIRKTFNEKKMLEGLNPVLIQLADDKDKLNQEYWKLPYQPLYKMTAEDFAAGAIPTEYQDLWKQYQDLATDELKQQFLNIHPELSKDFRMEYRQSHPEVDAILALWGYGGKIQSQEAYDLLVKESKSLGISLDNLDLKLPPQSLIGDYFSYVKLSALTSANSAESKLWRLQHPDFNNWAMTAWGWSSTSEYKVAKYYEIQVKYAQQFTEFDVLKTQAEKDKYLASNPDFWKAKISLNAYDKNLPEQYLDDFIGYYTLVKGDSGYDDDWYLMEHQDFYNAMINVSIMGDNAWKPKDFSKIPSRTVYALYVNYLKLPKGKQRNDFRRLHKDLDDWMVLALGYTPVK